MPLFGECGTCGDEITVEDGHWVHTVDKSPAGSYCEWGSDEEPDREPSAEQERSWNEQYDGTSFGA